MIPIFAVLAFMSADSAAVVPTPAAQNAKFEQAARDYANGDWASAKRHFEVACNGNIPNACANLGVIHALGQGVPSDNIRASGFYQKACSLNSGVGCANIGWFFEHGIGQSRDPLRAAQYYQQSCSMNFSLGCRHLGNLHMTGEGVAQDTRLAIAYLTRALELDPNIDRIGVTYSRSIAPTNNANGQ